MQRIPWHVADNCLTVDGVGVHGPELLWQHRLRGRILAVRCAETGFIGMRGCANDWLRRNGAVVPLMLRISKAVFASDGASLTPPEAWLAPTTLGTSPAHIARPVEVVPARASCRGAGAAREFWETPVHGVARGWNDQGSMTRYHDGDVAENAEAHKHRDEGHRGSR